MDIRSNDRDLAHYYYDFGGESSNSRKSNWLYKKLLKLMAWVIFIIFLIWFAKESYHGLIIYD